MEVVYWVFKDKDMFSILSKLGFVAAVAVADESGKDKSPKEVYDEIVYEMLQDEKEQKCKSSVEIHKLISEDSKEEEERATKRDNKLEKKIIERVSIVRGEKDEDQKRELIKCVKAELWEIICTKKQIEIEKRFNKVKNTWQV